MTASILMFIVIELQAVQITTGGTGAGGDAFMTISQDITFTITDYNIGFYFIIEDAHASGTVRNFATVAGMYYKVNEGSWLTFQRWGDRMGADVGDVTVNDSFLSPTAAGVVYSNDTVTLKSGTLMITEVDAYWDIFPTGDYDMFISDNVGVRISDVVSDPPAVPAHLSISNTTASVQISWASVAGQSYKPQYSTNLVSTNWFDLGTTLTGDGSTNILFDSMAGSTQRYYRVLTE